MVSPRPVPPNLRVVDPSAWLNASKTVACLSPGMPMPVSVTWNWSMVHRCPRETSRTSSSTCPRSVNLIALATRFAMTCCRRTLSPTMAAGTSGWMSYKSSRPFWSALTASGLSIWPTSSRSENGIDSSSSLRDSILEKSRMSLMIDRSDTAEDLTVPR